jgi:ribulose-phosphate 3-epimerase
MLDGAGNTQALINVDGGINIEKTKVVTAAGASVVVAGNYIYGSPDVAAAIKGLHEAGSSVKLRAEQSRLAAG